MNRKFAWEKRSEVAFVAFWLVAPLVTFSITLSSIAIGAQQESDANAKRKPNPDGWSKNVDGIAIRISPISKMKWGQAEIPTFKLEARNDGNKQKSIVLNSRTVKLTVDGKDYRIPSSVSIECQLNGNATIETLFRLRLIQADWDKANSKDESKNLLASLPELGIGKHKMQFQLGSDGKKFLSTDNFEFEVTENDFENRENVYVLRDFYGNPLKGAKVYAIGNGSMSVFFNTLTNNGFEAKNSGHYETEVEQGHKYREVEPSITDGDGLFSINALPNDTRIIVIPKTGSVQELSLSELKGSEVRLAQTGNLIVKRNVEGDESQYRVRVYRLPTKDDASSQENFNQYVTENMQFVQENGESYLLQKLRPGKYKIRISKSMRKEKQVEHLSSNERIVEIKADETTYFTTEYKKGQKVKVKVIGIKSDIDFVKAKLVPPGEIPNYSGTKSYWADGKFDVKKSSEFLSHKIPPGNYTLYVEATPGMDPGADRFSASPRPTQMASKTVVVQANGIADVGTIKLMPKDMWLEQSPNALRMKLVDKKGALIKDAAVFRLYKGGPTRGVQIFRANMGIIKTQARFGVHQFILISPTKGTMVFNVTVPNMVAHKIVVNEIPDWYNKEKTEAALKIKATIEDTKSSPVFKVLIENTADEDIAVPNSTIRFSTSPIRSGQTRLPLSCYFPDRLNNQKMVFRANSKTELEFKWSDMIENGLWRGLDLTPRNFLDVKPPTGKSAAKFDIGSVSSNIIFVPNTK